MYAPVESEYEVAWDAMNDEYNINPDASECMTYLYETYIQSHRFRFVRCFTNRVLHFDTTVTSRGEGAHAVLKKQL